MKYLHMYIRKMIEKEKIQRYIIILSANVNNSSIPLDFNTLHGRSRVNAQRCGNIRLCSHGITEIPINGFTNPLLPLLHFYPSLVQSPSIPIIAIPQSTHFTLSIAHPLRCT